LIGAEVAFTIVDPLQRVTSAVESKKFEWQYIGEKEFPLLPPCPDDMLEFMVGEEWWPFDDKLSWVEELRHGG
jgi:hypothetical protein